MNSKIINLKNTNYNSFANDSLKKRSPILSNIKNYLFISDSLKDPTKSNNLYVELQNKNNNRLLYDRNDMNNLKDSRRKYNLKNYRSIINKRRRFQVYTSEEELDTNVIDNFFNTMKIQAKKENFLKTKKFYTYRDKNITTNSNINYYYTNPDKLKIKENSFNFSKKKNKTFNEEMDFSQNTKDSNLNTISNSVDNQKFYKKISNKNLNRTEFPNIKIMKMNFKNLASKVDELSNNLEKIRNNIKFDEESENEIKINKANKTAFIKDKDNKNLNNDYIYEDTNINFLKNRKYFNKYLDKLNTYKYKHKTINKFFERKEEQIKNNPDSKLNLRKESEKPLFRKRAGYDNYDQFKLFNKIKELKNRLRSNDEDIFKVFNQNL
jgi:hypothetical protein